MQQPRKCDTKNQGNDLGIVAIQENILPVRGHPRITDGQNTITAQRHMIDTTASECCSRRKVRKRRAEARNRAAHSVYICGFLRSIVHVRKIRTGLPAMRPVRFSLSLLPCEREKGKISPTEQGVSFRATRRKSEENRRQRESSQFSPLFRGTQMVPLRWVHSIRYATVTSVIRWMIRVPRNPRPRNRTL